MSHVINWFSFDVIGLRGHDCVNCYENPFAPLSAERFFVCDILWQTTIRKARAIIGDYSDLYLAKVIKVNQCKPDLNLQRLNTSERQIAVLKMCNARLIQGWANRESKIKTIRGRSVRQTRWHHQSDIRPWQHSELRSPT